MRYVKKGLKASVDVKYLGKISRSPGIFISYDCSSGCIQICQECHVKTILDRSNMSSCEPVVTPMECKAALDAVKRTANAPYCRVSLLRMHRSVPGLR